jgi:2-polyprenyl-6-methoxyphenol hydroxylase-like FAD-dependent oxidoreductase
MSAPSKGQVLVSGASIAGPALAYWLHRFGFEVTVVERAAALRGGGYPIDIRGTAIEVVDRMGLLPQIRAAHVDVRRITYLDADGSPLGSLRPEAITGGTEGRDVEVPRGDLAAALYGAVRDDIRFRFDDSIIALHDDGAGVDVTFRNGDRCRFDLVVGADGLHSNTRSLVFGPEEQFHHYLGRCFAGFTMPNDLGLTHEGVTWNTPGRGAVLYAPREDGVLHAFLNFARPEPPFDAFRTPDAQRDLVASVFDGAGWEVPRMVAAMRTADDLFFDVVSQIRMSAWSRGRVALVGDAAYAPSFLSGQGSSVALVGAYVLAGELASTADHVAAFAAYERRMREFVRMNQGLAAAGGTFVAPRTAEELALRNQALRDPAGLPGDDGRTANSALALPAYAHAG